MLRPRWHNGAPSIEKLFSDLLRLRAKPLYETWRSGKNLKSLPALKAVDMEVLVQGEDPLHTNRLGKGD